MHDLTDPEWQQFQSHPDRVQLADEIAQVYRLVESDNITEAKSEWVRITVAAREKFKSIVLRDPDATRLQHESSDRIKANLWTIIDFLHRSTNNEPLQMHWREVTSSLFKGL